MMKGIGWAFVFMATAAIGCISEPSSRGVERSLDEGAAGKDSGEETPDAGRVCGSLGDLCSGDRCRTTWPADVAEFCGGAGVGPGGIPGVFAACDGYHVLVVQGVDMNSHSYYRADTNELVAITIFSANTMKTTCYGPPDFEAPTCGESPAPIECATSGLP